MPSLPTLGSPRSSKRCRRPSARAPLSLLGRPGGWRQSLLWHWWKTMGKFLPLLRLAMCTHSLRCALRYVWPSTQTDRICVSCVHTGGNWTASLSSQNKRPCCDCGYHSRRQTCQGSLLPGPSQERRCLLGYSGSLLGLDRLSILGQAAESARWL